MGPINPSERRVKVITDEPELSPILDFDRYSDAIANIIRFSNPKFSVGVSGEWGTGKTTLMRRIEGKMKTEVDVLTIWFNAWRYERENHFALIALLKTIAYNISDNSVFVPLRQRILGTIKMYIKDVGRQALSEITTEKGREELAKEVNLELKMLEQTDKDSIYFDGLRALEKTIESIRKNHPERRIVVFIDDLDRCSPTKALEVFESTKVFLDLEGFIFVIGLSQETVEKVISAQYRESGISGDQYIKKIIQIPITLPEWTAEDVESLISNLTLKLTPEYASIIADNQNLISLAIERNPRDVKRFINSFIVTREIFRNNHNIAVKPLLIMQLIRMRWRTFYRLFMSDANFQSDVQDVLFHDALDEIKYRSPVDGSNQSYKLEPHLKEFLTTIYNVIKDLDFESYRRALHTAQDVVNVPNNEIKAFQEMRKRIDYKKRRLRETRSKIDDLNRSLEHNTNVEERKKMEKELEQFELEREALEDEIYDMTNDPRFDRYTY